jgi:hypothetical protein
VDTLPLPHPLIWPDHLICCSMHVSRHDCESFLIWFHSSILLSDIHHERRTWGGGGHQVRILGVRSSVTCNLWLIPEKSSRARITAYRDGLKCRFLLRIVFWELFSYVVLLQGELPTYTYSVSWKTPWIQEKNVKLLTFNALMRQGFSISPRENSILKYWGHSFSNTWYYKCEHCVLVKFPIDDDKYGKMK